MTVSPAPGVLVDHYTPPSELVAEWASREARKTAKKTGVALPDPEQLTLD